MGSTDYARLRAYVEELIETWQEVDGDGGHPLSDPRLVQHDHGTPNILSASRSGGLARLLQHELALLLD